jgi:hypothetical protein
MENNMTKNRFLRAALVVVVGATLAGCVTDPQLNTGLSIGTGGVKVQPSVQATVGGGLLQYTPKL